MRPIAPLAFLVTISLGSSVFLAARASSAQTVDARARVVRHGSASTPITLPPDEMPDASATSVTPIALGDGKTVSHVRVPSKTRAGIAWEAIVADSSVIFAGITGYAHGVDGERTGEAVQIAPGANGASHVLIGDLREDLHICGQAQTLLSPRGIDPHTLALRGATVQRLTPEQRTSALRVVASSLGGPADPPLAPLLASTGASTAIGSPAALTDGNVETTWSEARPGDGHGEFVVMRAPSDVPIARLAITIAPPVTSATKAPSASNTSNAPKTPSAVNPAGAKKAAPRTFYLVTDTQTIQIEMPNDAWMHPGEAYGVPLVDPIRTSCVAVVLDEAYAHDEAHPEVTIAELVAYSAFDAPGATLAIPAAALSGGGARAEAAAAVLKRAGAPALAAVTAAFPKLDDAGRALAIDVASSATDCGASTPILLEAMSDRDVEVKRKGAEKLERCGKPAIPALVTAVRSGSAKARTNAAPLLATIAPSDAIDPLAEAMGEGAAPVRAAVRSAFARATRNAKREKLAALVADRTRAVDGRIDLLRALGDAIAPVAPEADASIADLLREGAPLRTRYLLIAPLATLARANDASALSALAKMMSADPEAAVRAHAAAEAIRIASAEPALLHTLADAEPRVREAALGALAGTRTPGTIDAITQRLVSDDWTFVRAAAAASLNASPASPAADAALVRAMKDASPRVREAAIAALGAHGARSAAPAIRDRLDEPGESLEVRVVAARALGTLCDRDAADLLTTLAQRAGLPLATEEETQVGLASIESLGNLHPNDLAKRLAPLRDPNARAEARRAAEAALASSASCK